MRVIKSESGWRNVNCIYLNCANMCYLNVHSVTVKMGSQVRKVWKVQREAYQSTNTSNVCSLPLTPLCRRTKREKNHVLSKHLMGMLGWALDSYTGFTPKRCCSIWLCSNKTYCQIKFNQSIRIMVELYFKCKLITYYSCFCLLFE